MSHPLTDYKEVKAVLFFRIITTCTRKFLFIYLLYACVDMIRGFFKWIFKEFLKLLFQHSFIFLSSSEFQCPSYFYINDKKILLLCGLGHSLAQWPLSPHLLHRSSGLGPPGLFGPPLCPPWPLCPPCPPWPRSELLEPGPAGMSK